MPLVDLDEPDELRARWAALAAVAHATGFDRRWYADDDGYHHQDETASVLRMTRLGDGRVVLWGFHTQHSATAGADLLAGSPDWIGQPEVRQRQAAGELGFVYGAFNGTWARASYPGDPWQPVDDGFEPIGGWIRSDEAAADEMIEWVAEWADYLGGLDELRPYGVELIRTAFSGITAEALGAFFAPFGIDPRSPVQPDLSEGVAAGEDFTRNFAVPASFADDPDTDEVSVVGDVVIGAPDSRPSGDEESYVVPPGISPFTGQPIDDPPAGAVGYDDPAADRDAGGRDAGGHDAAGRDAGGRDVAGRDVADDYGVTGKKQGWLRRRRQDAPPDNAPDPSTYPAGPAPGTYLPDDVDGSGLPTPPSSYDPVLPSAEPPRVGGGRYEGDDFYNSLFADAPAAAAPAADEQDWETAEQPNWSNQEPTSEYNPFAEDTAPDGTPEWTGPAWINGQWVEDPTAQPDPNATHPNAQAGSSHPSPTPGSAHPDATPRPAYPDAAPLPAQPGATPGSAYSDASPHPEQPGVTPGSVYPDARLRPAQPGATPGSAYSDASPLPAQPGAPAHPGQPGANPHPGQFGQSAPALQQPTSPPTDAQPTNSPFAPPGSADAIPPAQAYAPAELEDDDAPTAEIAAVLDTDHPGNEEEEPASFTGPSPFAPPPNAEPADRYAETSSPPHPIAQTPYDPTSSQQAPYTDPASSEQPSSQAPYADHPSTQDPRAQHPPTVQPSTDRQAREHQPADPRTTTARASEHQPSDHRATTHWASEDPYLQSSGDHTPPAQPSQHPAAPQPADQHAARKQSVDQHGTVPHPADWESTNRQTTDDDPTGPQSPLWDPENRQAVDQRATRQQSADWGSEDRQAVDQRATGGQSADWGSEDRQVADDDPTGPHSPLWDSGNRQAVSQQPVDRPAADRQAANEQSAEYRRTERQPSGQQSADWRAADEEPTGAQSAVFAEADDSARHDADSGDALGRRAWAGDQSDPGVRGSGQLSADVDADDQTAEIPAVVDEAGAAQASDVPSASRETLGREADGSGAEVDRRTTRFDAVDDDEDEIFGRQGRGVEAQVEPDSWSQSHPERRPGAEPQQAPWQESASSYPDPSQRLTAGSEPTPGAGAGSEPFPGPGPSPQPFPGPGPSPEPFPGPGPSPEPFPGPAPSPVPSPTPGPRPEPSPGPGPNPDPFPGPGPRPEPVPGPGPNPEPVPGPEPDPEPQPGPEPFPEPEPQPVPDPDREPWPQPHPDPEQIPPPEPEPNPNPELVRQPELPTWPESAPDEAQVARLDGGGWDMYANGSAHAVDDTDGSSTGGASSAAAANGSATNRPAANGSAADGHAPNAAASNGHAPNGAASNGAASNGLAPNGTAANGLALNGAVAVGADGRAGYAADLGDEEPTGFVPVVGDDEPTGTMQAVGFGDLSAAPEDATSRADAADAAMERMSIPGLGLVGGGGPRVAPRPGSIEEAMRAELERPRPRPQESDAVLALRAWCRARTAIVPSGFTIQVQVLDPGAPSYRFDLEPPDVDDPEYASDKLSGLLGDLWLTEQQSDQGGWLFARIDAAGRTLRIDRWYDQVPDWWDNPIEPRLDVNGLVRRLYSRGPQWQPSYLEKLYTSAR